MFKFGIEVEYDKKKLDRLAKKGVNTSKMMKETATAWGEITRRQFLTETDPEGKRWAKLRPSTLKSKKNSKFRTAIGRDSGYAFYSSGYKKIKEDSFEIGFKAKYLVYFHKGRGRKQLARPIYVFDQANTKRLLDKESKKLVKNINKEWES